MTSRTRRQARRRHVAVLAIFAMLGAQRSATAELNETSSARLEEIVVTASRAPRSTRDLSLATTVLDGTELERMRMQSLADALRFVPGLRLERAGARGGRTSIYLRGLDPNHTAVLVDGVRLNDPNNSRGGSFDPTTLDVLAIDRVEIVRGPLSAVHGADAVAGAINILTRRTEPDQPLELQASAGGGRYESGNARARMSGGTGRVGLSVAGSWATNEAPGGGGSFEGTNWKGTLDWAPDRRVSVRANARASNSRSKSFPDFSGGSRTAVLREFEVRDALEASAGIIAEFDAGDRFDVSVETSYVRREEEVRSPGVAPTVGIPQTAVPPSLSDDTLDRVAGALLARARPSERFELTAGADVYREDGRSDAELIGLGPSGFRLDRTVAGTFVELLAQPGAGTTITASLRADVPNEARTEWSPSVGATAPVPGLPLVLYGNWSEGFKLPSFYALGNAVVGNPDLAAERSEGWEAGIRATSTDGRLRGRIAYFAIDVDDLIDFDAATFRLVNRDRVASRGVETEGSVTLTDALSISGALTFNDTDIRGESDELRNRPRWYGHLRLDTRPHRNLEVGVRALLVGHSYDSSNPTGPAQIKLGGYERIDVTISWAAHENVTLFAAVENLLDADYEETLGFPAPGIYPSAGIEVRM